MKILVAGASGFIARQIVTELLQAGHEIIAAIRNDQTFTSSFPEVKTLRCDFLKDTTVTAWLPRLEKVEAVINCVGILDHPLKKNVWKTHYETPRALYEAAAQQGVKRIIQISALGVSQVSVAYAQSKLALDKFLLNFSVPTIILRPSLVYGRGSYGGTTLFRGLAGLPGIVPLPGGGGQRFQPIHIEDLAKAVQQLLTVPLKENIILNATATERVTLKEVLIKLRAWLGFGKAKLITIPLSLIRIASWLGNFIPRSSMNATSYKMMMQDNVSTETETQRFYSYLDFAPRNFSQGVFSSPASVQDRWHARLVFLKPLLIFSLAFVFLYTALCNLFPYAYLQSFSMLERLGLPVPLQAPSFFGAIALNAFLGLALLLRWQLKKICWAMLGTISIYSLIILWKLPLLWWIDPLTSLAKNIILLVALLVLLAIESDR